MMNTESKCTFEESVLRLFEQIHPLDQVQRAGYVLRGIASPESVSAHSHFVSLLTLLFVDRYPGIFDREKALAMALIHDLPEAIMMDIPMPASDAYFKDSKRNAEMSILATLFEGFSDRYAAMYKDLIELESPEAKLVSGLDKAQMMIKILFYQKEGRGRLEEFWLNPKNFRDHGITQVSRLFDKICRLRGVKRPT
jgi:putative hydrolase of HD superfamily